MNIYEYDSILKLSAGQSFKTPLYTVHRYKNEFVILWNEPKKGNLGRSFPMESKYLKEFRDFVTLGQFQNGKLIE